MSEEFLVKEKKREPRNTHEKRINTESAPVVSKTGTKEVVSRSNFSPSKNYQVLVTSLGKNLPPSLLPRQRKYTRINTRGLVNPYG